MTAGLAPIAAAYTGHERVEYGGVVHTGPSAEGDFARSLIGIGVDPATPLVFTRAGVPQLLGTVGAFARRAWAGAAADPGSRLWKPHPEGRYPGALVRWHALEAVRAAAGRGAPPRPRKAAGGPSTVAGGA